MGMVGILYRDPETGQRTTTPLTVARANLAEGKPFDAERDHRNTFGWINPVIDTITAISSPWLYAAYRGLQTYVDNRNERKRPKPTPDLAVDDPLPDSSIPLANTSDYNDARLGGVPVNMLYQLGAGYMQQTPAARLVAAKNAGRKGGQRSARRRKKKAAAKGVRKTRRARKTGKIRLKKGSAAAKAWGAKMKRARNKKRK